MRCAHGLRNGFAIAPAERGENPQSTKTNKKARTRRAVLLVAGVGFEPTTFRL